MDENYTKQGLHAIYFIRQHDFLHMGVPGGVISQKTVDFPDLGGNDRLPNFFDFKTRPGQYLFGKMERGAGAGYSNSSCYHIQV